MSRQILLLAISVMWLFRPLELRADDGATGKPTTQSGGNGVIEWDIAAQPSPTDTNRWYVYVVVFINRPPDGQRLISLLSSDWTYFYILRSADEVAAFNALIAKAAISPTWVTLPNTELFGICPGRIQYSANGKFALESEDYYITEPLKTYDRWVVQAKEQHFTSVRKRITGDLAVNFDVNATGDAGLLFSNGRLDAEGVERLRNCAKSLETVAENRLLPRLRVLSANEQKAQQTAAENRQKADLLK